MAEKHLVPYMREISMFWKRSRLMELDVAPLYEFVKRIEFLTYVKRVPKDVRIVIKVNFQEDKGPDDLDSVYFIDVLEITHKPEDHSDAWLILIRLNHSLVNMNARTNGTVAVPPCILDSEGMQYTIQGPPLKLRLITGVARLMSKPDRISARRLDFDNSDQGIISQKQMILAKHAYDRGYFDIPKRVKISELADELNLSRSTISEHLARIEAIIMDDMFSSFDNVYLPPEEMKQIVETIMIEAKDTHMDKDIGFSNLVSSIRNSIDEEIASDRLREDQKKDLQQWADEAVEEFKEHQNGSNIGD